MLFYSLIFSFFLKYKIIEKYPEFRLYIYCDRKILIGRNIFIVSVGRKIFVLLKLESDEVCGLRLGYQTSNFDSKAVSFTAQTLCLLCPLSVSVMRSRPSDKYPFFINRVDSTFLRVLRCSAFSAIWHRNHIPSKHTVWARKYLTDFNESDCQWLFGEMVSCGWTAFPLIWDFEVRTLIKWNELWGGKAGVAYFGQFFEMITDSHRILSRGILWYYQ